MTVYGLPVLATIALWWASTGAILFLHGLAPRTYKYTIAGASVLVGFAIWGLLATASDTSPAGAYAGFSYGVICWGWQITTFYTGFITGPRKEPCPPELTGLARFVEAVRTGLYHELACLIGAVALLALTAGQPNQIGVWTYICLWWMHESAKLNLFFGAPNLGEDLLPRRLAYLESFMARRPMNGFFPFSVTISTVATVMLIERAASAQTPFWTTSLTMLASLMALAVAEHWFLVAPMNANALWGSATRRDSSEWVAALEQELELLVDFEDAEEGGAAAWSVALPNICNSRDLAHVLELVAAGGFGEIDSVRGAVRTPGNWVAFEMHGARARMAPFEPRGLEEPIMVAKGRRFDRSRLHAALRRCAA
jgi:putative photosynthetic complex assembly protein 2